MTPKALALTLRAVADYVERWGLDALVNARHDDVWIHVQTGMTRRAAAELASFRSHHDSRTGDLPTAPGCVRITVAWRVPAYTGAPPDILAELPDPHGETDAIFERDPIAGTSRIASDSDARSGDAATVEAARAADPRRRVGGVA